MTISQQISKNGEEPIAMKMDIENDSFSLEYNFSANLWQYPGTAGNWYFITLPKKESGHIKSTVPRPGKGWGSIKVSANIGNTSWKTSIFPDGKSGSFLLPIKADIRKKENLREGQILNVTLGIKGYLY